MYYAKPYRIPAAALALYFLIGAGIPLTAQTSGPAAAEEAPSMPALNDMSGMPDMPGMSGERTAAPENLTPYQAGVRAYLKGDDDEAVSRLREALRLNADDEKAKRLLLKVMLRSINGNYEKNNYKKAHSLIQSAREYFPANPEVRLLYGSMLESSAAEKRKAAAPRRETTRAGKDTAPPGRATAAGAHAPVPARLPAAREIAAAPQEPAAAPLRKPAVYKKPGRTPEAAPGGYTPLYFAAIAAALLLSAALFVFIHMLKKQAKNLLQRIETLQKALVDGEVRRTEVYKELEKWKDLGKQDEELSALRKAKERRMYQELEKLKAEEETKILAELAEKRREAERAANRIPETAMTPPPPPPAAAPAQASPPAPSAAGGFGLPDAKSQESRILEMLAAITPPEREAAWERIAARAADLYETSPEAAIKFLYDLSRDGNPLNRASIVGALATIGAPATLDILFELYADASLEVRREAIKHLTRLQKDPAAPVNGTYREKISACLNEEKSKGDWIF